MKLSLQIKLAALIILGTASSLMGNIVGPVQNFEFQWQSSDGTFSPTFLNLTAALGVSTPASPTSITSFEITTPNGVWTTTAFTPTGGSPFASPFLFSGSFTVSGSTAAPVLNFDSSGVDVDTTTVPSGHYEVDLFTTQITGSAFFADQNTASFRLNDANNIGTGTWQPILLDSNVPDASNSLLLLMVAAIGLGIYQRFQSVRA